MKTTRVHTPTSCVHFGAGRRDITPPVGIYARIRGAASEDRATGVHRPLLAEALVFESVDASQRALRIQLDCVDLGDAVFVSVPGEPYSVLQAELQARFPYIVVMVSPHSSNLQVAYLLPRDRYGLGLYQEKPSPLAPGCLEVLIEDVGQRLEQVLTL